MFLAVLAAAASLSTLALLPLRAERRGVCGSVGSRLAARVERVVCAGVFADAGSGVAFLLWREADNFAMAARMFKCRELMDVGDGGREDEVRRVEVLLSCPARLCDRDVASRDLGHVTS